MAELKREYVVPLRAKTLKAPKWRRSKKAMSVLKEFIEKHMKTDNVIICNELNETIWTNGIKNPPGKVEVVAYKAELGGEEKCLVNLLSVGVEKQLALYKVEEAPKTEEVKKTKESKEEVVETEAVEVKAEEKKTTAKKAPAKKTTKKADEKKVEEKAEEAKENE